MLKSKKGLITSFSIVVMTIIVLTALLIVLSSKQNASGMAIGERQFNLIKQYQEAEKDMFYIDQAAKIASNQALHEFADNGGLKVAEKIGDISKWGGTNFPTSEEPLKIFFQEKLSDHLKKTTMSVTDYEISIINDKGTNIVGIAKKQITKKGEVSEYNVAPNFNIALDYDIQELYNIKDAAIQLVKACHAKPLSQLMICVNEKKPSQFEYCAPDYNPVEPIIPFCVKSQYSYPYYEKQTKKAEIKPLTYKFALDFSQAPSKP